MSKLIINKHQIRYIPEYNLYLQRVGVNNISVRHTCNVYVRFIKSVGMVIVVIKLETHITVIMVVQIMESKTLIKLFVIEYT